MPRPDQNVLQCAMCEQWNQLLTVEEMTRKNDAARQDMTHYHAQIVLKGAKDLFEYDLSKEYVRDKIAKKLIMEQPFLFGGASVKPGCQPTIGYSVNAGMA